MKSKNNCNKNIFAKLEMSKINEAQSLQEGKAIKVS